MVREGIYFWGENLVETAEDALKLKMLKFAAAKFPTRIIPRGKNIV